MKKLLVIVSVVLFISCVGLQIGNKLNLLDVPEIEGVEMKPINDFLNGLTIKEIQKWEKQEAPKIYPGSTFLGLSRTHDYESIIYLNPEDPDGNRVGTLSVMVDGKAVRLERIGLFQFMFHPFYGPVWNTVALVDRYKNTDKWYLWDRDPFLEQHPEFIEPAKADPDRFKRHDACANPQQLFQERNHDIIRIGPKPEGEYSRS